MRTVVAIHVLLLVLTSHCCAQSDSHLTSKASNAANTALQRLKSGNQRFVAGKPNHPHENAAWRHKLENEQHPFAVVLGCSDSRVPPELIFDQGIGDLFVVRVAGNVVDTDVIASIEYAIDHLQTPLIVVMGHEGCGAVSATVDHLADAAGEPAEVVSLLYRIEPATIGLPKDLDRQQRISMAVERNVDLAVRRLSRVPDLRKSISDGTLQIAGAVYDMHSGKINFRLPQISAKESGSERTETSSRH